jgi:predicted amidohydrolase YtcJ
VPESSFERRLAESRRALEESRRWGVTSLQDMSPLDQIRVYEILRDSGELTARIQFSPSRLSDYEMMIERGWTVGSGDEWIRLGSSTTGRIPEPLPSPWWKPRCSSPSA